MEQAQNQVFDVDVNNFEAEVINGSKERVIVVDFWAPWCEPCKTLGPVIEEVVRSLGAGVALAKVNVDENPQLAQVFKVQGIPAVKIVKDGQLVQEFTGALPKEQIEEILRPLVPVVEGDGQEGDLLAQAQTQLQMGDMAGAAGLYEQHLEDKPDDAAAILGLARARLFEGNAEAVEAAVAKLEKGTKEHEQGKALLEQIGFASSCTAAGGRQACAAKMLADADDLEARYNFACCAAAEGDFESALREWFAVTEKDREWNKGAAKEAMVAVFRLLGRENELVADYQRQLYRMLH
jgi:putative thioredoxin